MGIIHKYFSNNFSKPVREKFKWWVVNSKNADIEEESNNNQESDWGQW